jgi:hypothetical protein
VNVKRLNEVITKDFVNVLMMGMKLGIDRQDRRVELPGCKRRTAKKTIIANNNYAPEMALAA